MLQLAATLSLLASGGYQHLVGNDFLIGVCQSTVSKIVGNVVKEMEAKLCPQFIKFSPDRLSQCTESFVQKYKIPGGKFADYNMINNFVLITTTIFAVIGCIDGTHFGLQNQLKMSICF